MALGSIFSLVQDRLPFIQTEEEVNPKMIEVMYILQSETKLDDTLVEIEGSYTSVQRILIADITAYYLLQKEAKKNVGGTNGQPGTNGKVLKRAKADVVESEFEVLKVGEGQISQSTVDMLADLKSRACNGARKLGYIIPLCLDQIWEFETPAFIGFVK
jgi:hypothetical protein